MEVVKGFKGGGEEGKDGRRKRVRCKDGAVRIVVRKCFETTIVERREENGRWERMRARSSGVLKTVWAADILSAILRRNQNSLSQNMV